MISQSDYARHAGISRQAVSKLVQRGLPLDSVESADRWRGKGGKLPVVAKAIQAPKPKDLNPIHAQDLDSVQQTQEAIRISFQKLKECMDIGSPQASIYAGIHATESKNLIQLKRESLELDEYQKVLVTSSWVKEMMQKTYGVLVTLVKSMPKQLSGRILPNDPAFAEEELSRWVNETYLKTLHETNPWKE